LLGSLTDEGAMNARKLFEEKIILPHKSYYFFISFQKIWKYNPSVLEIYA